MTTESVKTMEGELLPLKEIGKNYIGNPEDALRFVNIKEVIESHEVGDIISVKAGGYALFKGFKDATNVVLFLSDKVALSFNSERTTGKQIMKKLKEVLAQIGSENADRLRGAEVIYTFKLLEGLDGNYLTLVKMEFTGVVKEFESKVEVSGADSLLNVPSKEESPVVFVETQERKNSLKKPDGGIDYGKLLNKKEKH